MIAIGFTGLSGCGKDIAASFLGDIGISYNYSVVLYKLADVIREELKKRKVYDGKESRKLLLDLGNELRETFGMGVLAHRIITNYNKSKLDNSSDPDILIVTGIRNKGEVETFRKEWGSNFILISIQASENIRTERKIARNQYKDDQYPSHEIDKGDKDIGIVECMELSDLQIINNGTIDELKENIQKTFTNRILPMFSSQNK
jgi:dephospho-CoA kinase